MQSEKYKQYPKINTLWKRNTENKWVIIPGEFSDDKFKGEKKWHLTEKIDGTNIRVIWEPEKDKIIFRGRKQRSQIPPKLEDALTETFSPKKELFSELFGEHRVILFGEGFGGYISGGTISGEKYHQKCGFILFDVWENDEWYPWDRVKKTSQNFDILHVPSFGVHSLEQSIAMVKSDMREGRLSSHFGDFPPEGVVATIQPLKYFENGDPIRWKLKTRDYDQLEKFGKNTD